MRRFWIRTIPVLLALVLGSACDDADNVSLFVKGIIVASGDDCELDPNAKLVIGGGYDISSGAAYRVFPVYRNQVRARTTDLANDPNAVPTTEVEIELLRANGDPLVTGDLPNPFTVPTSAFVPSAGGSEPDSAGAGVGGVDAIPAAYASFLPTGEDIVITMRTFGVTTGDVDIESGLFSYVVSICDGCLRRCAGAGDASCTPGSNEYILLGEGTQCAGAGTACLDGECVLTSTAP